MRLMIAIDNSFVNNDGAVGRQIASLFEINFHHNYLYFNWQFYASVTSFKIYLN